MIPVIAAAAVGDMIWKGVALGFTAYLTYRLGRAVDEAEKVIDDLKFTGEDIKKIHKAIEELEKLGIDPAGVEFHVGKHKVRAVRESESGKLIMEPVNEEPVAATAKG